MPAAHWYDPTNCPTNDASHIIECREPVRLFSTGPFVSCDTETRMTYCTWELRQLAQSLCRVLTDVWWGRKAARRTGHSSPASDTRRTENTGAGGGGGGGGDRDMAKWSWITIHWVPFLQQIRKKTQHSLQVYVRNLPPTLQVWGKLWRSWLLVYSSLSWHHLRFPWLLHHLRHFYNQKGPLFSAIAVLFPHYCHL